MEQRILDKLKKVLALTTSPVEGEAQAAAETLQRLLTTYNLDIADLEAKGHQKPAVGEEKHDLGKAAFKWKLDLAEAIAEHYYCLALVDRYSKTIRFVGRPDNVESLRMLYAWFIDQIKRISAVERRAHIARTGDHVDPLRWQVGFGVGAAQRLGERLRDVRRQEVADAAAVTALTVSHNAEISDYLEEVYGYRRDGRETKVDREYRERYEAEKARRKALRESDPEAYYTEFPDERPLTPEEEEKRKKEQDAYWKKYWKAQERNERRRTGRSQTRKYNPETERKELQTRQATRTGYAAGDAVNLKPFVGAGKVQEERKKLG